MRRAPVGALVLVLPFLLGQATCAAIRPGPDCDSLVRQLDGEVVALRNRNQMLENRSRNCQDPYAAPAPIYSELHQVFSSMEVEVWRNGATTLVGIPGEQLFGSGSVRVRREAMMVLDLLADALKAHPEQSILVTGHTDDKPLSGRLRQTYASNWELSSTRAAAVIRVLVGNFEVSPERFTVAGRAEFDPIEDNSTPEGRASNRRVVVSILPPEPE